jgi:hypothetical protein
LDEVICTDRLMARDLIADLGDALPPAKVDGQAISEADFDGLIEQAVTGEFPIAGGLLSFERTRAMGMIDIDGVGDPLALNLAAAKAIPPLLRLLDIGGPLGIDFISLGDRKARQAVDAALVEACTVLGPHKCTAVNGFGFAQIIRQRSGPSIPEIVCGTTPGRLSLESRAAALLREAGGPPPGRATRDHRSDPPVARRDRRAALCAGDGYRTGRRRQRFRLWPRPCQPVLDATPVRSAASRAWQSIPRSAPPPAATATC